MRPERHMERAQYYAGWAIELRAQASEMKSRRNVIIMLSTARTYDQLERASLQLALNEVTNGRRSDKAEPRQPKG